MEKCKSQQELDEMDEDLRKAMDAEIKRALT